MDLATSYLGLTLKHPLIASSSPLTGEIDNLRKLEDAGAAAVVLPSIFEEQIESEAAEYERLADTRSDSFPEALSYFPPSAEFALGPHRYLELIHRARAALEIPVIASLNGSTSAGWTEYARMIQQAGASALELNSFFVPVDAALDGRAVEQRHLDVLRAVKEVGDAAHRGQAEPAFQRGRRFGARLDHAGANGFVLFNRFYQPDIDLLTMRLSRNLDLSTPAEIRLPLLWIGVLAGQVRGALAAATGVESAAEAVKYLLVGADVVMTTSALLRYGIGHMNRLLADLTEWLDARGVAAIDDIRGKMSRERLGDPPAFERANYISILHGWTGGA